MRQEAGIVRFGPFALDSHRRRLESGSDPVWLPDRQMDVLVLLVQRAGHVVSKDALIDSAWQGLAVSDNSLAQAIKGLRQALGVQPDGSPYIETKLGRGYRFTAAVSPEAPSPAEPLRQGVPGATGPGGGAAVDVNALLDPYRAFVEGRAAIERLDRGAIDRAREALAEALRREPAFPAAHIGMANACVLGFDATRVDLAPDRTLLDSAARHALEACRLAPSSGDAWSTLAHIRHRQGAGTDALAAARKAVVLEPEEWRHFLRLAFVGWGAERLLAAYRVLSLRPALALGHWFAATVFVARGAFDAALKHLRDGCAAQDEQRQGTTRFTGLGLHYLHGLVLAANGAHDAACEELLREISLAANGAPGHIYARECAANAWYALGALAQRQARLHEACLAFHEALTRVPGHALAALGLTVASGRPPEPFALR